MCKITPANRKFHLFTPKGNDEGEKAHLMYIDQIKLAANPESHDVLLLKPYITRCSISIKRISAIFGRRVQGQA